MASNNLHEYDGYIASLFAPMDPSLTSTLAEMKKENVPSINVSAVEGKLLQVLTLATGAKRVLEIGTLGGFSGIHFARALPEDGKLITLELDPHHAEVSRRNFDAAGVGHKVQILVATAADSLKRLVAEGEATFDIIFIDADKVGYPEYLRLSLPLLRSGGLLLADNTLPDAVLNEDEAGAKTYNADVSVVPELTTILIPIIREQGIDGLTLSVKK